MLLKLHLGVYQCYCSIKIHVKIDVIKMQSNIYMKKINYNGTKQSFSTSYTITCDGVVVFVETTPLCLRLHDLVMRLRFFRGE